MRSLARSISLFTTQEIKKLLYQARLVYHDPRLDIKAAVTNQLPAKILVVAPKKMGTAPQRNLIKRRLKSLFYEEKLYEKGFNLVVYCKKGSALIPYNDLKAILTDACQLPRPNKGHSL